MAKSPCNMTLLTTSQSTRRQLFFFGIPFLLTAVTTLLFLDLLNRRGWTGASTVLAILFSILFFILSVGAMHAVVGFFVRWRGSQTRISAVDPGSTSPLPEASTAIVIPIYNEPTERVCEGLRAIYESLEVKGTVEHFDFYILSDTTDPARWIEEEARWFSLVRELNALGRIYYRRRSENIARKSGNVRDFLRSWGKRHRYMVVLDADSIMTGDAIVQLVRLMESRPQAGLIQTAPRLVRGKSLFARMQQFANALYGPLFISGLNYWSREAGNYWGHNAIIRVEPFMKFCDLPILPGRKPFGGEILSHDFVEAALLIKEGWEVWLADDIQGTYEEGPPSLIDAAVRDRRWCQGNLQHSLLLFANGLRGASRTHLGMGILGYLIAPLWLSFLMLGTWMAFRLSETASPPRIKEKVIAIDYNVHVFLILGITFTLLFSPKILALLDLLRDRTRRAAFGGFRAVSKSIIFETLCSALLAPILMLFHTFFVVNIFLGRSVSWNAQERDRDGTSWIDATLVHWPHTLAGCIWTVIAFQIDPNGSYFLWLSPIAFGLLLSIPLSVFTSRTSWGNETKRDEFFLIPEELEVPPEIASIDRNLKLSSSKPAPGDIKNYDLISLVLDPYLNAVHVSLLKEKNLYQEEPPGQRDHHEWLCIQLLQGGPSKLTSKQKMTIISDPESLINLHAAAWQSSTSRLASEWRKAIKELAA